MLRSLGVEMRPSVLMFLIFGGSNFLFYETIELTALLPFSVHVQRMRQGSSVSDKPLPYMSSAD